mgnify:CR=1 FL=1
MQSSSFAWEKENLPVYQFLKEPLIRKFGEEWYKELVTVAEELKKATIYLKFSSGSCVCNIADRAKCTMRL